MKKALGIIITLVLAMLGMSLALADAKEHTAKVDGVEYSYIVNEDGTATISDASLGKINNISIPATIDGYSVTSIGSAFFCCFDLMSVSLPDSVTSIGYSAFYGCSSLTSILIPNSVTSIGDYAFYGCSSLISISIPDSVTSIGDHTFRGCDNLVSIAVTNDSVFAFINGALFEKPTKCIIAYLDKSATSYVIPDGIIAIGNNTFYDCPSLISISIPDSVTSIGEYAFSGCENLTSISIPDGVTSIGNGAFYGCIRLTSIYAPDSVISIGDNPFVGCNSLGSIEFSNNSNFFFVEDTLFEKSTNSIIACLNNSLTSKYAIPNGVIKICPYAFSYCDRLTSISIPDSVTSIGEYAFFGCENLTSASIPDSVTTIGEYAFSGCENLTSISIPDGITSISDSAFSYCYGLTSISIPDSVTTICESTFSGCRNLTSVFIPDSVTSIEDQAFRNSGIDEGKGVLHVVEGSYAHSYAIANGYNYDFATESVDMSWLN